MNCVAGPSKIPAITGLGIADMMRVDISPVNYTFEVQAMSAEKFPLVLAAEFTIGPRTDDDDSIHKFSKLISPHDKQSNHLHELVQGIIEGEARALAASMTMEAIFKGTKEFLQEVSDKVQLELNQFGLHIYDANVQQLVDVPGHEYFSYLGQKTQMEAANQARVKKEEKKEANKAIEEFINGLKMSNKIAHMAHSAGPAAGHAVVAGPAAAVAAAGPAAAVAAAAGHAAIGPAVVVAATTAGHAVVAAAACCIIL